MKRINIMFAAALLAVACTKNDIPGAADQPAVTRLMCASFEVSGTRTSLDGTTPHWAVDDQIMMSNGTDSRTITLYGAGEPSWEYARGVIDAERNVFTFSVPAGWTTVYAVYPASCSQMTMVSGGAVNFSVPRVQEGTFAGANICAAKSDGGMLQFRNVTSVVNIAPNDPENSVDNDYMYLGIDGRMLSGDFTVSFGDNVSVVPTSGGKQHALVQGPVPDNGASYYAVAPQDITSEAEMEMKVRKSGTLLHAAKTYARSTPLVPNRIYNFTHDWADAEYTENCLQGWFTVADGRAVRFSPGNLYWSGSAWKFEARQQDFPTVWNTGHVGYFFWTSLSDYQSGVSAYMPYAEEFSCSSQSTGDLFFCGEDNKLTVDGSSGWYAPSLEQWCYLMNYDGAASGARTQANRFAKAMVGGCTGIVIFSDGYNGTTPLSGVEGLAKVNSMTEKFPTVSIPSGQWKAMEADGCAFLPNAGFRNNYGFFGENSGDYWLSSPSDKASYAARRFSVYNSEISHNMRDDGFSVRTVRN